jgi:signal transduction histidine kinase
VAIAAYRVAREALSNVAKHSHATRCTVTLQALTLEDGHTGIRLVVSHNGQGFAAGALPADGVGLIGMRERVVSLSGSLVLSSSVEQGTRVTVDLPTGSAAVA